MIFAILSCRYSQSGIYRLPVRAFYRRQPRLRTAGGEFPQDVGEAVMVGARRIELRFDFGFAAFADLYSDVRIDHDGFAQCDKFRPAGFKRRQNIIGGKQVAHADKGQFAVDAVVNELHTGLRRIAAAADFLIEFPQGNVQVLQRLLHQRVNQRACFSHGQPVLACFFRRETVADDEVVALVFVADGGNGIDDGERKAHSVFQTAAPLVAAAVALGGVKLLD